MNFPANCDTQGPSKFKKDTLTTLKLVRKYNPAFVTTFIVSYNEAHCLTGDDLRRCENMITLKKKKEIHAKYSGLLKSNVKAASYDIKSKKKASARGERPKTPRHGRGKIQSRNEKMVKGAENLKSIKENLALDSKITKPVMKEIFKSNVYLNYSTTSIVDDSVKCPNGKKVNLVTRVSIKNLSLRPLRPLAYSKGYYRKNWQQNKIVLEFTKVYEN